MLPKGQGRLLLPESGGASPSPGRNREGTRPRPTAQLDCEKHSPGWGREGKEACWGDVNQETLQLVKRWLEESRKEALVVSTQAPWHERIARRLAQRNGFDTRALSPERGARPALRVPRSREGRCPPTVLPRDQRRQPAVHRLLRDVCLAGGIPRRVGAGGSRGWASGGVRRRSRPSRRRWRGRGPRASDSASWTSHRS